MNALHIVSGGDWHFRLTRLLGRMDPPAECLVLRDDLSFGSIAGDLLAVRAKVRAERHAVSDEGEQSEVFWRRLDEDGRPLIIWFARHCAQDLAMVMALCDRYGERDLSVIDVTDLEVEASWNGACLAIRRPRDLGDVPNGVLARLVGKHVPLEPGARRAYAARWRMLRQENAPFRVVGAEGLVSAKADAFDHCLMAALSHEWRRTAWVVGMAEHSACATHRSVGRQVLLARAAALVEQEVLEAQGSVWDIWDDDECGLRLPARSSPISAEGRRFLHVASNQSFGGFLWGALHEAGRLEEVAPCPDELNAGPIATGTVGERATWLAGIQYWADEEALSTFWKNVSQGLPLVVWFGRGNAQDLCLYHALCETLPERIAAIGDVSTLCVRCVWTDGTEIVLPPPRHLNEVPRIVLPALPAHVVPPDPSDIAARAKRWRELRAENAPFRIAGDFGLTSQPETYFDDLILATASTEWRKTARIVGGALSSIWEPFTQVGDAVLLARIVALVEAGVLEARGDPWLMRESELRLASAS